MGLLHRNLFQATYSRHKAILPAIIKKVAFVNLQINGSYSLSRVKVKILLYGSCMRLKNFKSNMGFFIGDLVYLVAFLLESDSYATSGNTHAGTRYQSDSNCKLYIGNIVRTSCPDKTEIAEAEIKSVLERMFVDYLCFTFFRYYLSSAHYFFEV